MKNKHYTFERSWNIRDLGGYLTNDGKTIRLRKFIRGTGGSVLFEEEKELLYRDGVRVVIDLRSRKEVDRWPHPLKDYLNIKYFNVDMMGSFVHMLNQGYDVLYKLYFDLINFSKELFKEVLDIILLYPETTIYFSCTAGKDRTGLLAMILLWNAGVSEEDIIDNYAESYKNLLPMMERGGPYTPAQVIYFYSEPEYMIKAMDLIKTQYGGIKSYLEHIGLTSKEVATLRDIMVE